MTITITKTTDGAYSWAIGYRCTWQSKYGNEQSTFEQYEQALSNAMWFVKNCGYILDDRTQSE